MELALLGIMVLSITIALYGMELGMCVQGLTSYSNWGA